MRRPSGFTIIEVVLFLAISGSLAIVLLMGTGAAIQRQQYRDAVQSFAGYLKGQYSKVINVENDRQNDQPCPISGVAQANRGQSNCVIIGRYIQTVGSTGSTDGRKYQVAPVYALDDGTTMRYGLGTYEPEYEMGWSAHTRFSNQAESSAHIAILMYRDPKNGSIVVRANSGRYGSNNIGDFFIGKTTGADSTGDLQFGAREICIYDRGWLVGQRQSIFLGLRAGSSEAVTVGNSSGGCNDQA